MSASPVLVRLVPSTDLRDVTVGYLASRGRTVAEIAEACELTPTEVRAEMRRADAREGRVTLWCATVQCQSYTRGVTHLGTLTDALATGWRHDLRARLLCPVCSGAKATKKTTKRGSR